MKKMWIGLLSFAMLFACTFTLTNNYSYAEDVVTTIEGLISAIKSGVDIKLDGDIIIEEAVDISEIANVKYDGTFDGNGHTITNLSLTATAEEGTGYLALIPQAKDATIKNLKLAGTLTFDLDSINSTGGYVGGIVGYGENVTIQNCEVNLTSISDVSIDKNITFGVLAGRIDSNEIKYNVEDCVAYYNSNVALNDSTSVAFGGLVGTLSQGAIVGSINNGNITYAVAEGLEAKDNIYQYFGGIVGSLLGTDAQVRNCLFGGALAYESKLSSLYAGAIIGACPASFTSSNIRYDYYLQSDPIINPVGDGRIAVRSNFQKLSNANANYSSINQTVLQDSSLFDGSLKAWDFATIWDYKNSQVVLQRFEKFEFKISPEWEIALSTVKAIKSASLVGAPTDNKYAYGQPVQIQVKLKDECKGWFENLVVYKNTETEVPVSAPEEDGVWTFTLTANASTAGTYSFSVSQKRYDCIITTEDIEHGGVKLEGASAGVKELSLAFNYSNTTRTVVAQPKGVYVFDCWDVYFKDDEGNWNAEPESIDVLNSASITIVYDKGKASSYSDGTLTLGEEFNLVARYISDPAVVDFQADGNVTSITFNGEEYQTGTPINVSKTAKLIPLKITVKKGYQLDVSAFENEIIALSTEEYTESYQLPANFHNDIIVDEEGNSVYSFNIDVSSIKNYVENRSFTIKLVTTEAEGTNTSDLLWLWITLAVVGVFAIVGTIILIVLKKRKGGGRGMKSGKGGKTTQEKTKSASYKDYFI